MTALQKLLKYTIENAYAVDPEGGAKRISEDELEIRRKEAEEEAEAEAASGPAGGDDSFRRFSGSKYSGDKPTPTEPEESGATKAQIAEHERIMTDYGEKIAVAEARRGGRIKERAAETPPAKNWQEQLGRDVGRTVGTVGSASKLATEVGGAAATAANQAATGQQGRIEQNPAGVGTGASSRINRAKIARQPLGTPAKTPSMSAKVRMNKPVTPPPSKVPVAAMMEKDYVNDKYEEEFGQHDIPERKTKDHMKVSGKGVQNLQKLIGERAQQVKKKRGN